MAAAGMGKFLFKKFQGKEVEIFTGMESEYIELDQFSTFNRFILRATVIDYDEECGIITLKSPTGHEFYLNEFKIELIWEADTGFELLETLRSMIRTGKDFTRKNRDIM